VLPPDDCWSLQRPYHIIIKPVTIVLPQTRDYVVARIIQKIRKRDMLMQRERAISSSIIDSIVPCFCLLSLEVRIQT
jgi:hypothetical protein